MHLLDLENVEKMFYLNLKMSNAGCSIGFGVLCLCTKTARNKTLKTH